MSPKERHYRELVELEDRAQQECKRTYAIWQDACERRIRIAAQKEAAYIQWVARESVSPPAGQS